jgi:hypothetical protein
MVDRREVRDYAEPHQLGEVVEHETNAVVYESPGSFHIYESLLPASRHRPRSRRGRCILRYAHRTSHQAAECHR